MILVTGGAASGKSELAEKICCTVPGRRLYIAAMRPFGAEAEVRIARHRTMRADKGFDTAERYHAAGGEGPSLHDPLPGHYDVALLEDLGNLVANQMFEIRTGPERIADVVLSGIEAVSQAVGELVIVANEIFSGAEHFDGEMLDYMRCGAQVHLRLAARADTVVEAVCGLPLVHKGRSLV